ncbi:hypothetical protein FBU30_002706 [Linnemannia zychae]|nr:hypothetical protein FBU30_002706 [Linnemannia zychae]
MNSVKTLFLSWAPLMVTECVPLIIATAIYELDIIRYLFFGNSTKPIPPSRRKLDSTGFLSIPDKAKSWLGTLVATICGIIWFFSEFALDIILIFLGQNSTAMAEKQAQYQEDYEQQQCFVEKDEDVDVEEAEISTKWERHYYHHHHHHYYENSEENIEDHQPQQQLEGDRRWRRESQREEVENRYEDSNEGEDIVEQQVLLDDISRWETTERSVECEAETALYEDLVSQKVTNIIDKLEEDEAVLSSVVADDARADLQGSENQNIGAGLADVDLLPAYDPNNMAVTHFDTNIDVDTDDNADTEVIDEPMSLSSSPLSSAPASCVDLHIDSNIKKHKRTAIERETAIAARPWNRHNALAKNVEAPTPDDRMADIYWINYPQQDQILLSAQKDFANTVASCQDPWSIWGPGHLSRAVKTIQSTQQKQQQPYIETIPSSDQHCESNTNTPPSPLVADSNVESLSDDNRAREERRRKEKYLKKKTAKKAKKAKKAAGMPLSPADCEGSLIENSHLSS